MLGAILQTLSILGCIVWLLVKTAGVSANLVWDEAVHGDLSNDPNLPTMLDFATGSNVVMGSMVAPAEVRDFLTFQIDAGQALTSLWLLSYEDLTVGGPGNIGFHAINAGATSYIPSGATAGNFLGGDHIAGWQVGSDLLVTLSTPLVGTGFTIPLGPGTYSYVIQQTGPQLTGYALDFHVVPEVGTTWVAVIGLAGVSAISRRRRPGRSWASFAAASFRSSS